MELNVLITQEQVEQLIEDPASELVFYFSDGTRIIVRISDEYMDENETVH